MTPLLEYLDISKVISNLINVGEERGMWAGDGNKELVSVGL